MENNIFEKLNLDNLENKTELKQDLSKTINFANEIIVDSKNNSNVSVETKNKINLLEKITAKFAV